ncbi:MAG TPA: Calx-beta domain-containing protein [Tepidisphaeraceae bacterium]
MLETRRLLSDGAPDTSFANSGVYFGNPEATNDATNFLVEPDGSFVVVGDTATATGDKDAFIDFIAANGQSSTYAYQDFNHNDDIATALARQSDGKIIVVGTSGNLSQLTGEMFVSRFNMDGTLDDTFNGNGYREIDFGGLAAAAGVIVNQTTGQIVIAGADAMPLAGSGGIAFAFVNPDGTMNTNFGNGTGMTVTNPGVGTIEAATSLVQAGPDFVVSGFSVNALTENSQMMLAEFNPDGTLNTAFGNGGRAFASFGNSVELGVGAAVDPNSGNIYEVGTTANGAIDLPPGLSSGSATATPTTADFAIASFTAGGMLNTTFNGTGEKTLDFNGNLDAATSISVQQDGKILVGGGSQLSTGRSETALARLNPDGSLDTTFNPSGGSNQPNPFNGTYVYLAPFDDLDYDASGEEILEMGASSGFFHIEVWANDDGSYSIYGAGHDKIDATDGKFDLLKLTNSVGPAIAPVEASITPPESASGAPTGTLTYTISLSQASTQTVTVNYTSVDTKQDKASADYDPISGTVTFAPGETSQTVTLNYHESKSTSSLGNFQVNLTSASGATLVEPNAGAAVIYVRPNNNTVKPTSIMATPSVVVAGSKAKPAASVVLTNSSTTGQAKTKGGGSSTAGLEKGSVTINIYASTDSNLDTTSDPKAGSKIEKIFLKAGQSSKPYAIPLSYPLATGITKYYLFAEISGTGVTDSTTDFVSSSSQVSVAPSVVTLVAVASNPTVTDKGGKTTVPFTIKNTGNVPAVGKIAFSAVVNNSSGSTIWEYGPPNGGPAHSASIKIAPNGTGKASLSFNDLPNSTVPAGNYSLVIMLISSTLAGATNTTDGSLIATVPLTVT